MIPRACIRGALFVWWRILSSCVRRRALRICCCGFWSAFFVVGGAADDGARPWTQRRLQRAFMMRKVDRTGQLSEFNPLPMVTALLGLDGEDEDAEDAEEHNLAGEKKSRREAERAL